MAEADDKIRCDACPVMCFIKPGMLGACDRYGNDGGRLVRIDPHVMLNRTIDSGGKVTRLLGDPADWDGDLLHAQDAFVTAVGAGTTYPDYKPAPFIVSSQIDGVDMVTVVTEGIYSYCGVKVKVDTDRHLGPERSDRARRRASRSGHVTTGEYGSQMLSLGGVNHLTHGGKKEGRVTCQALMDLCNCKARRTRDRRWRDDHRAGRATHPSSTARPRSGCASGCGSATIGMFARQWFGKVDEVVVVDDHITGVLSEHQAGKVLGIVPTPASA